MEHRSGNFLPAPSWAAINAPRQIVHQNVNDDGGSVAIKTDTETQVAHVQPSSTCKSAPEGKAESPRPKPRTPLPTAMPLPYISPTLPTRNPTGEKCSGEESTVVDNLVEHKSGEPSKTSVEQNSDGGISRKDLVALFPSREFWQPSDTELRANGKKVGRKGDIEKVEGHANAWAPTLAALGLVAGNWPKNKISLAGMAPHDGKAESSRIIKNGAEVEKQPSCQLPFVLYLILHRAPERMLLLDQLFNITLAVVPFMNPKNATTRHCLSTHSEFKNVKKDHQGKRIAGWTIATRAEFDIAEAKRQARDAEKKSKSLQKRKQHPGHELDGENADEDEIDEIENEANTRPQKMAKVTRIEPILRVAFPPRANNPKRPNTIPPIQRISIESLLTHDKSPQNIASTSDGRSSSKNDGEDKSNTEIPHPRRFRLSPLDRDIHSGLIAFTWDREMLPKDNIRDETNPRPHPTLLTPSCSPLNHDVRSEEAVAGEEHSTGLLRREKGKDVSGQNLLNSEEPQEAPKLSSSGEPGLVMQNTSTSHPVTETQFSLGSNSLSSQPETWSSEEKTAAIAYIQAMYDRNDAKAMFTPQFREGWDRHRHAMALLLWVNKRTLDFPLNSPYGNLGERLAELSGGRLS